MIPDGIDLGLRLEYVIFEHNLNANIQDTSLEDLALIFPTVGGLPTGSHVRRHDFTFGIVVTF